MNVIVLSLLVVLLSVSLSMKYLRYSSYNMSEREVTEKINDKLKGLGWDLKYTIAMNSNRTSQLMVLQKENCSGYLYINLSGSDASNVSIFKKYLDLDKVDFILSDRVLDNYVYFTFYSVNVYNRMKGVLTNKPSSYSPLVLTYTASREERCSLIAVLAKHNKNLDIIVSDPI